MTNFLVATAMLARTFFPAEKSLETTSPRSATPVHKEVVVSAPKDRYDPKTTMSASDFLRAARSVAAGDTIRHGVSKAIDLTEATVDEALAAIESPTMAPNPDWSMAEAHRFYVGILEKSGITPFQANGKTYDFHTLLLRGVDTRGQHHSTRISDRFDDVLVLLGRSGFVMELEASSHPSLVVESSVTPTKGGVAMVDAGQTVLMKTWRTFMGQASYKAFRLGSGSDAIPSHRNTAGVDSTSTRTVRYRGQDYDDVYTAQDKAGTANGILLHAGSGARWDNASRSYRGAVSVGCANLPPSTMRSYAEKVGTKSHLMSWLDANAKWPGVH